MSGIEIAGLVLGAFPLLISAAEHYREGFEPLVKWKRFRTDFIGFIDAMAIEKELFDNMLERFLISADVPHEELQAFMTIENYVGWQRADLVKLLQLRLGPSYSAFMSTIKTMHGLMEELKNLLLLKDGEVSWARDGASKWDYQMKRIHLSFSKKGTRTLAALESHNRKLNELLDSKDKLDSLKAARQDTTWANIFECIRHHASSLHSALRNGWHCDCSAPHTTSLRLQKRITGGWSSQFSVKFSVPQKRLLNHREFIITVKEKNDKTNSIPDSLSIPETDHYLSKLRENFQSKSSTELNLVSRPLLRTLSPSESDMKTNSSSRSSFREFFSSKSESTSSFSTFSSSNGTQSMISTTSTKPKKSVRIQPPSDVALLTSPVKIEPMVTEVQINDLCTTLCSGDDESCLGYLLDDERRQHELRPLKCIQQSASCSASSADGLLEIISLDTLLARRTEYRLSRHDRYRIASVLASSLLQFQASPWLANKLEKKNIFFYRVGTKISVEHPYIRETFASSKIPTSPSMTKVSCITTELPQSTRFAARNSLSHLGILLLELCFGQPIENQDFRSSYLGTDGKAHEGTDYMTARDWAEMVCEEDPALEHIIKCCIFCVFEEKADWENKKFVQAVYASVVEPLEKIIEKWSI